MWVGLKRILRSYLCLCLPSSRLLGPSAAADILQLSSSLPLQSRGRARLLVGNEDVHIIARSDDELLDDFFHEQSSTGGQAGMTLAVHQSSLLYGPLYQTQFSSSSGLRNTVIGEGVQN